jgi:site-specific recombinase XerC
VQVLLGHSKRQSTRRYPRVEFRDALKIYERNEI